GGRFVDDIRLAGALHACFVRSPYAHAKIRSLDAFAARAMPGVHAVLTADDLPARMARSQIPMLVPNPSITAPRTQLALARREVCYVGQTIAVAIADNRYLAEDAAAAVNVDFETLPAVSDCREAARPDAPPAHSDLASNVAAVVAMSYADEAVIPAAAMKLGRPVAWQEDRREHFLSATQERDQYWKVAIAVDNKGKILGLSGTLLHDTGAFLPWGIIMPYISATTFPGPYVVPAYRVEATVVFTNRVPTTVVRGAGRPQAVFAMERLMDRIARELDIDRAELRRRNMIGPEQ